MSDMMVQTVGTSRPVLFTLHCAKEFLGNLVQMRVLILQVWGWAQDSAFLMSFQVMQFLLVPGAPFK